MNMQREMALQGAKSSVIFLGLFIFIKTHNTTPCSPGKVWARRTGDLGFITTFRKGMVSQLTQAKSVFYN